MPGISIDKWRALQLAVTDPRLRGKSAAVFARLLDHHNAKTGLCFPSLATLGAALNCEERTIRNALRALERNGYVQTRRRCNRFGTNQYELKIPTGKTEYQRAEIRLQEYRKGVSAKPSKEPLKEPTEGMKRRGSVFGSKPSKTNAFLATAKRRAMLETELITRLGRGEGAWNKMFSIPDALLESAAKSLDGSAASIERAVATVLRECQFEEIYGTSDDDCRP